MRRIILLCLALAALLAVAGCSDDEPATRVDLSRRIEAAAPAPPDAVTYAYLPQYSHTISYQRHHRLVEYLARATGLTFRQVFPATFDDHLNMVGRGEIDISFSNPFIYVRMADAMGARAFARTVEPSGKPFFRGQIITRKDNTAIRSLDDCRGKRWIAVDPHSAGGYLFALGHFMDHGLTSADFREVAFAPGPGGNQEKVVMAVYAGKYDIGSIREGTLELLEGRIELDRIRVLAETRSYPGWVYAARRNLDPAVVDAVRMALLALDPDDPEHAAILRAAHMHAIHSADDADYAPVRELAAKVGPTTGGD
ncbi:MAG: phosphate/phosphite/phosphonate ABC transporter substrate-binding protein [Desulfovibrionaceae bacterium]